MVAVKKYKIIVNPAAGRGRARPGASRASELFRERGAAVDLEFSTGPKQAEEIARRSLDGFDAIVAVGGDGTVNEVLPALLHGNTPLGIIPAGSGNDFIKALNIPNDIAQAVDVVLAGTTSAIDVGRINDRYFANGVGFGFDAAVNRASFGINHSKRGLWLYSCALVKTLGRYEPIRITVSVDGDRREQHLFLLTVGNGTTVGGGFKLTPHAKIDDGLLDVTMVTPLGVPMLLWHLPKVFRGTIERARRYARLTRAHALTVKSQGSIPVHVDGEIFESADDTYRIDVLPRSLLVITRRADQKG